MMKLKNILLIVSILLTLYFSLGFKINNQPCEEINKCKCSFHNKHNLKNNYNMQNYSMFFQMENILALDMENKVVRKAGCSLCYSNLSFNLEKDLTLFFNSNDEYFEKAYFSEKNEKLFIFDSILIISDITHLKYNIIYIKSVKLNC